MLASIAAARAGVDEMDPQRWRVTIDQRFSSVVYQQSLPEPLLLPHPGLG